MAGTRCQPEDTLSPEATRQPVNEAIDRFACSRAAGPIIEPLLAGIQPRHFDRVQRHKVDTETRIETRDLFAKETPEMAIVPAGCASADRHVAKRAVGAIEREAKAAAADTGPFKGAHEIAAQPIESGLDAGRGDKWIGERQTRGEIGRLHERSLRFGIPAHPLIETPQYGTGEQ